MDGVSLSNRQRRTLEAIFRRPALASIRWADIESLLLACGARIIEGSGSRIRIELKGVRTHTHRPHPRREASRNAVERMRRFLVEAEIEP